MIQLLATSLREVIFGDVSFVDYGSPHCALKWVFSKMKGGGFADSPRLSLSELRSFYVVPSGA